MYDYVNELYLADKVDLRQFKIYLSIFVLIEYNTWLRIPEVANLKYGAWYN